MKDRCTSLRPLIHDYLEGELATKHSQTVREHLEACSACRSQAQAWVDDLYLLLELDERVTASQWSTLKRKLRWRGVRGNTQISAWLQVLCAIAAFAVVFGAVGFLIWLESNERGATKALQYDAERRELSFHLTRGERCRFGSLVIAAASSAPTVQLQRMDASEAWQISSLWGAITVYRQEQEWFVVEPNQRWWLPLDGSMPQIELNMHARLRGEDLGPWPGVELVRLDGSHRNDVAKSSTNGRVVLDLPLRIDPPLRFEAVIDAVATPVELPPPHLASKERTASVRYLELQPERYMRYVSVRDAASRSMAEVQVEISIAQCEDGPKSAARSSELGIAALPVWFAGPYTFRVRDAQGNLLFEQDSAEFLSAIAITTK